MIEAFEEPLEDLEQKEEDLYRELVEAANYVSEHSMMHYGGRYETTELLLNNEQAEQRLEQSIQNIEEITDQMERNIQELELKTIQMGSSPRYVEKAMEEAEDALDDFEDEIEHIREARERPPEEEIDQSYVEDKDTEAQKLADRIEYTPTREET